MPPPHVTRRSSQLPGSVCVEEIDYLVFGPNELLQGDRGFLCSPLRCWVGGDPPRCSVLDYHDRGVAEVTFVELGSDDYVICCDEIAQLGLPGPQFAPKVGVWLLILGVRLRILGVWRLVFGVWLLTLGIWLFILGVLLLILGV